MGEKQPNVRGDLEYQLGDELPNSLGSNPVGNHAPKHVAEPLVIDGQVALSGLSVLLGLTPLAETRCCRSSLTASAVFASARLNPPSTGRTWLSRCLTHPDTLLVCVEITHEVMLRRHRRSQPHDVRAEDH